MEKMYEFVLASTNEEESKSLSLLISKIGKMADQINVGQRVFSYPIKKNTSGYYSHLLVSASIENFDKIKKELDFHNECLRYLAYSSKRSDLKPEKERVSRPIKENEVIPTTIPVEETVKKVKTIKKAFKKVEKIEEKVKINELDEKLKKLLEE